jgi:hypothetical protein
MRDRKHESLNHYLHRCPASLLQVLHVSHTSNLETHKGIATNRSYFSEVISEQTVTEGNVNINRLNSHVIQAVLTGNAKLLNPKLKSTRQVVPLIYAVQGLLCAIPYQLQGIGVIAQCHKPPLLFRRLMPADGSDGEWDLGNNPPIIIALVSIVLDLPSLRARRNRRSKALGWSRTFCLDLRKLASTGTLKTSKQSEKHESILNILTLPITKFKSLGAVLRKELLLTSVKGSCVRL